MLKEFGFVAITVLSLASMYLIATDSIDHVVRYDCRISEISPDYPAEVKEACRRIQIEKTK